MFQICVICAIWCRLVGSHTDFGGLITQIAKPAGDTPAGFVFVGCDDLDISIHQLRACANILTILHEVV